MSTATTPSLFETLSGLTPRKTPTRCARRSTSLPPSRACLTPHRITSNCPGQDDAQELVDELLLLCARVDKVVEAYGEYAAQHFHGIEMKLFKNQLLDALEGNALVRPHARPASARKRTAREYEVRAEMVEPMKHQDHRHMRCLSRRPIRLVRRR